MTSFGERLRNFRISRGLRQRDLAAKSDMDPSTLSRLEGGVYEPRLRQIEAMAHVLGVSPAQLAYGDQGADDTA